MTRKYEKPKITPDTSMHSGDVYSHPAYGLVTLSQTTGGSTTLFGSDIGHNAAMRIQVQRAELRRDLGRDWVFGKDILCEFEMSHAQFAQFITSQGNGSGTPITLLYAAPPKAGLEVIPAIEHIQSKADLHRDEIGRSSAEQIQKITEELAAINVLVESGTIPKKALKERLFSLNCHVKNLPGNLEYSVKAAEVALEKATSDAKIEVESYSQMTAHRLGLDSISKLAQLENKA